MIEVTQSVDAAAEKAWKLLLHRMEHPADYVAGIESSAMLAQAEQSCIRKIETPNGSVTERIVRDKEAMTLSHFLVKHPFFQGTTVYEIEDQGATCLLHIRQDWKAKKPAFDFEGREEALQSIAKELAERIAAD